ncbi:MAG: hypothetical protein ACREIA_04995, partial [Opitutaceae bacterium]
MIITFASSEPLHFFLARGGSAYAPLTVFDKMQTAVALILFNRPQTAARALELIAAGRPRKLFVIADGPRPDRPEDVALCVAARRVV